MTFTNQASETICHMIHAMSKNAEDMRDLELTDIAIRMEGEVDGLFMALAICERCGMTEAKGFYYAWEYERDHESE